MARNKAKLRVIAGGKQARAVVQKSPRREAPKPLPVSKSASLPVMKKRAPEVEEPIDDPIDEPEQAPKTELPRFLIYAALILAAAGALYIMLVRRR